MNPHPISLLTSTLKSTQNFFWSVSTPDMVIINDTLENGDLLLLPGKVKVYFEGEFIGESSFPLIAPQEKIDLGMRRSYDIKVEKKMKARQAAKEGLLKGKISKGYNTTSRLKYSSRPMRN